MLRLAVYFLGICIAVPGWAWPPIFGPEFTFTNSEIRSARVSNSPQSPKSLLKLMDWQKLLALRCQELQNCTVVSTYDKHGPAYRVTFSDGWYFNISVDMAVLEVQTAPLTSQGFRSRQEQIQKEIFDSAAQMGLIPHEVDGCGHIHLGLAESFDNNSELFRNFIVDYANRPELTFGILGNQIENSPPIAALKTHQRQAFQEVINAFDQMPGTILDLAKQIELKVYTESIVKSWGGAKYYQALRFTRFTEGRVTDAEATVEMRGFRPQQNTQEFVLETELLEARLKYLKTLNHRIPFINPPTYQWDGRQMVARFYQYVTETGLEWERYRTLLPEGLRNIPVDQNLAARLAARSASGPRLLSAAELADDDMSSPVTRILENCSVAFSKLFSF